MVLVSVYQDEANSTNIAMVRPKKTFQKHKFDFEVFREMGLKIEKFFYSFLENCEIHLTIFACSRVNSWSTSQKEAKKPKMACVLENKCFFKSGYQ